MGTYAYRYCMCFTRKFRSPDDQPPPDVLAAHHSLSSAAASSGGDDGLRQFLSQVQGESPADVHRILAQLTATTSAGGIARRVAKAPALSLDDFFRFLFSPDLNPPIGDQVLGYSLFPLTVPELALLRIEVQDYNMSEKHDFGGQTCLPVCELKQGIRAVPLHNRKGNRYKSVRLLMRFQYV